MRSDISGGTVRGRVTFRYGNGAAAGEPHTAMSLENRLDAAQERGEVAGPGGSGANQHGENVPGRNIFTVADLGLTRKAVHEARQLRDAEAADPGVIRRTLDARLARGGEEPTRAAVRVTPYPHGIGATVELVRELCQRDPAMLVAFDRAIERPAGNPNRDEATGRLTPSLYNVQDRPLTAPTGNAAQAGIRRIRKAAEAGDAAEHLAKTPDAPRTVSRADTPPGWRPPWSSCRATCARVGCAMPSCTAPVPTQTTGLGERSRIVAEPS